MEGQEPLPSKGTMTTDPSTTSANSSPGHAFMYGVLFIAVAGAAVLLLDLNPEVVIRLALYPAIALSILVLTSAPTTLTAGVSAAGLTAMMLLYSAGLGLPVSLTGMTVLLILVGVAVVTGLKSRSRSDDR